MREQLQSALTETDLERENSESSIEELSAIGSIIVLEGSKSTYPLKVDSLERVSRPANQSVILKWLLLSVHPATDVEPQRANVWVADSSRRDFLGLFEDYLNKMSKRAAQDKWKTPEGNPANQELVANISRIRRAVLKDLWTSAGDPPSNGTCWWEIWLDAKSYDSNILQDFISTHGLRTVPNSLAIRDRVIVWVEASWDQLQILPFTSIPVAEVRRPEFIDTIEDLSIVEQDEYVSDLAARIIPAHDLAPAVCHLDSGVFQGHALIRASLDPRDVHTVVGSSGEDRDGHGTSMAGLALFGVLESSLNSTFPVRLDHRLESVRMRPTWDEPTLHPIDFGSATASAIAIPEATIRRPRVYCLPLSTKADRPGEPTLWSSTVDALAVGTDIVQEGDQIRLLTVPDESAARLIVVAAGNVDSYVPDHRSGSDISVIEDPAQAWNGLTVSACTNLVQMPTDPSYSGWRTMSEAGELSPHSRTSVLFRGKSWPIKPDICMEGGNVLTDDRGMFEEKHPLLSLRTTGTANDLALVSANATSAATAQAARLAALAMARYPEYWPETVRCLLTHSAEWTPSMREEISAEGSKKGRLTLLRRYGWGTPDERNVLYSSQQAVTLVSQDRFVPFDGKDFQIRHFRLHSLPWPVESLEAIGDEEVRLRISLSYFVEPTASRRGWRRRYSYASHGLRFDLKGPLESGDDFVRRVNQDAQRAEERAPRVTGASDRWLIGPYQRNLGSLHQDEWTGSGHELAMCNSIAVYPVGGWWKNTKSVDRMELPVRYGLIVSLQTAKQGIDLYTPIELELQVPVAVAL